MSFRPSYRKHIHHVDQIMINTNRSADLIPSVYVYDIVHFYSNFFSLYTYSHGTTEHHRRLYVIRYRTARSYDSS